MPLPVSVVIPAYRRPEEARRAVRSVLAQTTAPAEVIVVDDASGDGTADAAREAGATVVALDENRGEGGARNAGIAAATQPWIALLDSDDEWLPFHLERLWALRGEHVVAGAAARATGAGPKAGRIYGWHGPGPRVLRTPNDVAWPENMLLPSGTLLRRDALLAAGGFAEGIRMAADFDTWLRLLEQGTGVASPTVSVVYHLHDQQVSGDRRAMHVERIRLYEQYRDRRWYDPRLRARMTALDAWDLRDARMLVPALLRPQGALGLLQTFVHRHGKRRAGRALAGTGNGA